MLKNKLNTGDIVEVLQLLKVAKTLDSNGTLDDLPFMADMIQDFGKNSGFLPVSKKRI
jgi:hypothetical protein